jgi:hypothetical protein
MESQTIEALQNIDRVWRGLTDDQRDQAPIDLVSAVGVCQTALSGQIMKATIVPNEIEVRHTVRPDVGREFLTIQIEDGWDGAKQWTKKVLLFEGRRFVWVSWNSDNNTVNFVRLLDREPEIATVLTK